MTDSTGPDVEPDTDIATDCVTQDSSTVPASRPAAHPIGLLALVVAAAALATITTVLAIRDHHHNQRNDARSRSVATARQAAAAMTSIDWQHADADVAKILAGATGSYRDDFVARSGPLVDVIKNAHATSKGTVVESAIESSTGAATTVLVTVQVSTTDQYSPQPSQRSWRIRMTVQPDGDTSKVAKVEFVS